jgi:hypothetical protein
VSWGKSGQRRPVDRERRTTAAPQPSSRPKASEPIGTARDERPSEAPRSAGRYETIARAPEAPQGGGRGASAADGTGSRRLGVRPARLAHRSAERHRAAVAALRVLYRDFLAGGGLDITGASRCPGRWPPEDQDR